MYNTPSTSVSSGTFLHKGFYDLLAMIPTPSPSRLIWGPHPSDPPSTHANIAGPRYENIPPSSARPSPPINVKKGHKISKAIISKPTGFVHLIHASDAQQLEALLIRWGPDGLGKLGDPLWAAPIKAVVRRNLQKRVADRVVNESMSSKAEEDQPLRELRVVNGMSTPTSSSLTTAAQENINLISILPEGFPVKPQGCLGFRQTAGLPAHSELEEHDPATEVDVLEHSHPRPVHASLHTLDKAVSARIYFENLYFPLLRRPPSREQRRLAMEKDMDNLRLDRAQREHLRALWRQNETEYLRERRQKVNASAFINLKTIGHGAFGVVSLVKEQSTGNLYAMKQVT